VPRINGSPKAAFAAELARALIMASGFSGRNRVEFWNDNRPTAQSARLTGATDGEQN
jgi:hypothetical protein